MNHPKEKNYFDLVYQAAKKKDQKILSTLIPQEIITVDLKDTLGNTVAGKLAFEGDLDSAEWLYQHAWASPHGIVQGAARNPKLQEAAYQLFEKYHTHPIWLIQGLAFSGNESKLKEMIAEYMSKIYDGRTGFVINYHGPIAAQMVLGQQETLYKSWRKPLLETDLIGKREANHALLCIARALGVMGNSNNIEEFLQWLSPSKQTHVNEFERKQIILGLYRGLAQGGHDLAKYSILNAQELLPAQQEITLATILGHAASGHLAQCQNFLNKYALTESRLVFTEISPARKSAAKTFFEFGYQGMAKALLKDYQEYSESNILNWDIAPDIFAESMVRGYIPHLKELIEMPSYDAFLETLEAVTKRKIDLFHNPFCSPNPHEGEDLNIAFGWTLEAASRFLQHVDNTTIVNQLYSMVYNIHLLKNQSEIAFRPNFS